MRFILRKSTHDYDESWFEILDETTVNPPLEGARLEDYETTVEKYPQITIEYKNEALLDDKGEPYIHSWNDVIYEPSWDEWCETGTNHTKKETSETYKNIKNYEFSRNEIRYRWVIDITDISLLEDLFKRGWSVDNSWKFDRMFYLDFEAY